MSYTDTPTAAGSTLAAIAAAASQPASNEAIAAAAAAVATSAAGATAASQPAPAATDQPAAAQVASASTLTAAIALELAALAIPSAAAQLTALAASAGEKDATEAGYRAACLKVAAGSGTPTAAPLQTSAPTTAVAKPDDKKAAAAIPSAETIYAARAKAMAG